MPHIFPGRYTTQFTNPQIGDSFVVFLIGMRVNRFWALRRWTRVAAAMPPMIAELQRNPSLGLLHAQFFMYWRGVGVIQYWRSFDQLHAYAHDRSAAHMPAWAEFNRRVGGDGSVGIWHETYQVARGQFECIYNNMPRFGLAMAADHLPIAGRLETARSRIGQPEPAEATVLNNTGEQR